MEKGEQKEEIFHQDTNEKYLFTFPQTMVEATMLTALFERQC
jgi:hypothetical protein